MRGLRLRSRGYYYVSSVAEAGEKEERSSCVWVWEEVILSALAFGLVSIRLLHFPFSVLWHRDKKCVARGTFCVRHVDYVIVGNSWVGVGLCRSRVHGAAAALPLCPLLGSLCC